MNPPGIYLFSERVPCTQELPPAGALVALDCETSGLHPDNGEWLSVVSLAWYDQDELYTWVGAWDHGCLDKTDLPKKVQPDLFTDDHELNLTPEQWHQLCRRLEDCHLVGHNLKFDLLFMRNGLRPSPSLGRPHALPGPDLTDRVAWDTSVISPLLWPGESTALKATAQRLWGVAETEHEQKLRTWVDQAGHKSIGIGGRRDRKRYDLAPWELLGPYAEQDAVLTLRLAGRQWELLQEGEIPWPVVHRELELMRTLTKMELRGLGFDAEQARVEAAKMRVAADQLAHELPFQPPTPAGAKRYFYGELQYPPSKVSARTGQPSVDEESVRILVEQGVPGAAEYARYTKIESALSKWYNGWPAMAGDDGRLRCVFHQTKSDDGRGTVSGRLSVQRVQLQAIPHDYQFVDGVRPIRDLFRASPGRQLWELDLSQAEFRVAAAIAHEEDMLAEFAAGYDAHDATCRLVFDIDDTDPEWDKYRAVAKRLGFGILYGAGARRIVDEIGKWTGLQVTVHQVESWLKLYGQRMPRMLRMGYTAETLAKRRGWVRLAGGRLRHFGPDEETRKAWNAVVQGSVAELMKEAMIEVERQHPGALVLQVHDSVWVEVEDESGAHQVGAILSQVFEQHYESAVAFPTGAKRLDRC